MLAARFQASGRSAKRADICWHCLCRQIFPQQVATATQYNRTAQQATRFGRALYSRWSLSDHTNRPRNVHSIRTKDRRDFSYSAPVQQQSPVENISFPPLPEILPPPGAPPVRTRDRLRLWQEIHGQEYDNKPLPEETILAGSYNGTTRLGNPDDFRPLQETGEDADRKLPVSDTLTDYADLQFASRSLQKGDLVEIWYGNAAREPVLAVFVRQFRSQSQYYTMHGKWIHTRDRNILFSVPSFVRSADLEGIIPYLPTEEVPADILDQAQLTVTDVPRTASAPVVDKLQRFWLDSEAIYRKHASILDNAHQLLAHDVDMRFGTLPRIAQRLLQVTATSPTLLYAVRKALTRAGFGFSVDRRNHRATSTFLIRSNAQVRTIQKVRDWFRDYQDYMAENVLLTPGERNSPKTRGARIVSEFIQRAVGVIDESRTFRKSMPPSIIGPSSIKHKPSSQNPSVIRHRLGVTFSEDEQEIVRYLEAWASSDLFSDNPVLMAPCSVLLKAVGRYEEHFQLGRPVGYLFLQEIGVLSPHENRRGYDENLLLPTSEHSKPLEKLARSVNTIAWDTAELQRRDVLAGLRKDFKDMPVYAIDDPGAHEIDDGISIERVPGSDGVYWVHVHIANPSAFFDKDHVMGRMAAHMSETVYTPAQTWYMLNHHIASNLLSLGNDRAALTFSTKMDSKGNSLEYSVQPSTVRKVIRLTPQEIRTVLNIPQVQSHNQLLLRVGPDFSAAPDSNSSSPVSNRLDDSMLDDIKLLSKLTSARAHNRERLGGISFAKPNSQITLYEKPGSTGLSRTRPWREQSRLTEGDPTIEARMTPFQSFTSQDDESMHLVKEAMLLACETGAAWCSERNIPIPYRGTVANPDAPDPDVFFQDVIRPQVEGHGEFFVESYYEWVSMLGRAQTAVRPLYHRYLGLKHYSKLTSPLRRYGDLLAHWQIQAALLEEARTGKSLVGSNPRQLGFLPFSAAGVQAAIERIQPRERLIDSIKQSSVRQWFSQLLARAFYFDEAKLPETMTLLVTYIRTVTGTSMGVIQEFATEAVLLPPSINGLPEVCLGDRWEVKIATVTPYYGAIELEAVRLIRRQGERAD